MNISVYLYTYQNVLGTSIENALGHPDNHTGRGGQDHRSIRMIEQPLITPNIFSSKENISEVLRRIRYKYRTVMNPRNKLMVTKEQYDSYYKFTFLLNHNITRTKKNGNQVQLFPVP